MKIAALAVTPKWHGGVETAFKHTIDGLRELGHEVTVIGAAYRRYDDRADFEKRSGWREQALQYVDQIVLVKSFADLENALTPYDGVILSDVYFSDRYTPEVLLTSKKMAPWTSGWHTNMVRKAMLDWHEKNKSSPAWTGSYVGFWNSAHEVHPMARWHDTVLPYRIDQDLKIRPFDERNYDFILTSRIDPRKGIVTYISALEGLARRGRTFTARLAGTPMDFPGGPYSYGISEMLENWGWSVYRVSDKMRANWSAIDHKRTNSVIDFTGNYEPSQLNDILMTGKTFVNATSGKASNSHLEYSTLEAINAGCMIIAPADWDAYHYGSTKEEQPWVTGVPEKSYRIQRGKRIIYNDCKPDAVDKTYDEMTDSLEKALLGTRDKHLDNSVASVVSSHNRDIITKYHTPIRAAQAFVDALSDK